MRKEEMLELLQRRGPSFVQFKFILYHIHLNEMYTYFYFLLMYTGCKYAI